MIRISIPDELAIGAVKELDDLNETILDYSESNPSDLDLLIDAVRFALVLKADQLTDEAALNPLDKLSCIPKEDNND